VGANLTLGLVLISGIGSASWSGELEKTIGSRVGVLGLPGGSRSTGESMGMSIGRELSGPGSWSVALVVLHLFLKCDKGDELTEEEPVFTQVEVP
jgi:hypothetical protein